MRQEYGTIGIFHFYYGGYFYFLSPVFSQKKKPPPAFLRTEAVFPVQIPYKTKKHADSPRISVQ